MEQEVSGLFVPLGFRVQAGEVVHLSALRGYWSNFRAVAKVALEDSPQLREKLGLLERS